MQSLPSQILEIFSKKVKIFWKNCILKAQRSSFFVFPFFYL